MKRSETNPLLRFNDASTWDTIDFTKSGITSIFRATGLNTLEIGEKLYEFEYKPLLDISEYHLLLNEFENSTILVKLYELMSFKYFIIFRDAVQWFVEKNKVVFDFEFELQEYDAKIKNDFSCPLVKYIDLTLIGNTNFYGNLREIINYSEGKKIKSIDDLLYQEIGNNKDFKYTEQGQQLSNSVINIAYFRFRIFLKECQCNKDFNYNVERKIDKFENELGNNGFFDLPMVNSLSASNKEKLVSLISSNKMPYGIAMFNFLGFCEYLDGKIGTKYKSNHFLSKLYNGNAKDGTKARHERNSLIKKNSRHTSYLHIETVKKHYQQLK